MATKKASRMRKVYFLRFLFRVCVLIALAVLFAVRPESADVIGGTAVFSQFHPTHLLLYALWGIWTFDMIFQIVPSKGWFSMGSLKVFGRNYSPCANCNQVDRRALRKKYFKEGLKIWCFWGPLSAALALAWFLWLKPLGAYWFPMLFVAAFYVCDLICVLFWCPFRVWFMKNRCCTTCRIFNWDHFMMFTPFLFVPGVYTWSLAGLSMIIYVIWEVQVYTHPERFTDACNDTLKCKNCTDRLCGKF
jgi:hypothetical protein